MPEPLPFGGFPKVSLLAPPVLVLSASVPVWELEVCAPAWVCGAPAGRESSAGAPINKVSGGLLRVAELSGSALGTGSSAVPVGTDSCGCAPAWVCGAPAGRESSAGAPINKVSGGLLRVVELSGSALGTGSSAVPVGTESCGCVPGR